MLMMQFYNKMHRAVLLNKQLCRQQRNACFFNCRSNWNILCQIWGSHGSEHKGRLWSSGLLHCVL